MSSQSYAAEQLLELLLHLKKTTPAAAREILNSRPPIAYALMTLMVSMNAVNFDVFQKTLAEYGANQTSASVPPSAPVSTIPPPLAAQYHTSTPSSAIPPVSGSSPSYPNGQGSLKPHPPSGGYSHPNQGYPYGQPQTGYPGHSQLYGGSAHMAPQAPASTGIIPDTLASIPDDQKALIMRVISMTPEEINMLAPVERATFIQLRATLGIPTG